jgi:four helix bundle protein
MKKGGVVVEKSEKFALRIVKLYRFLAIDKKEVVLSKQVIRSGTSIGANIAESTYAQSDADFLTKLTISLKECNETIYWLSLLYRSDYLNENEYDSIKTDCDEHLKLLISITKSIKEKLKCNS